MEYLFLRVPKISIDWFTQTGYFAHVASCSALAKAAGEKTDEGPKPNQLAPYLYSY
jgi:hypothetical protein